MQVGGILETALYVSDIERAAEFYRRLFGFPTLPESDRLIAMGVAGRSVPLLFPEGGTTEPFPVPGGGGVIPPHGGSPGGYHYAFSIASEDVELWRRRLESEGVAVESVVSWPGGAKSLCFRDPDGNLADLVWRVGNPLHKVRPMGATGCTQPSLSTFTEDLVNSCAIAC